MTQMTMQPRSVAGVQTGTQMTVAQEQHKRKVSTFKGLFTQSEQQLADVLPKHLTPERQIRLALLTMNKVPKLLDCQPMTVLSAVITASQLGLEIGGPLGEAHLVPYGSECQLIVGYQGLQALAMRSAKVLDIEAEAVYAEDFFEYERGLTPKLIHRPNYETEDRGEIKLVYAIATLAGGAKHVEVVAGAELRKLAEQAKAKARGRDTPWATHYEAMCKKTGIRRVCKFIPRSAELRTALEINDAADFGSRVDLIDGEVVGATEARKQNRASALASQLAKDGSDEVVSAAVQEARDNYESWVADAREAAGALGFSTEDFTELWDAAVLEAEQDEHGIPTAAAISKISTEINKGTGIWQRKAK